MVDTSAADRQRHRKAPPIALALWRRGLTAQTLAALPYTDRSPKVATATRFARQAYREAGCELNPPGSADSPTWTLVAVLLEQMQAFAATHPDDPRIPDRDLLEDRAQWLPAVPEPDPAPDPARDVRYTRSLGTCRACGTPVRWVTGPQGVLPLHPKPTPNGRWIVDEGLQAVPLLDGEPTEQARFEEHWPVCPGRLRSRAERTELELAPRQRCTVCQFVMHPDVVRNGRRMPHLTHPACDPDAVPPPPLRGERYVTPWRRR
jgi:hypothetical protein